MRYYFPTKDVLFFIDFYPLKINKGKKDCFFTIPSNISKDIREYDAWDSINVKLRKYLHEYKIEDIYDEYHLTIFSFISNKNDHGGIEGNSWTLSVLILLLSEIFKLKKIEPLYDTVVLTGNIKDRNKDDDIDEVKLIKEKYDRTLTAFMESIKKNNNAKNNFREGQKNLFAYCGNIEIPDLIETPDIKKILGSENVQSIKLNKNNNKVVIKILKEDVKYEFVVFKTNSINGILNELFGKGWQKSIQSIKKNDSFPPVKKDDPLEELRTKPCLLLVEDNVDYQNFLKNELEKYYEIHTAKNGKEALELMQSKHHRISKSIVIQNLIPDLIISDVVMPEMDGYSLIKEIIKNDSLNFIPFIFLTEKHTSFEKMKGLSNGAIDYISKHSDIKELKLKIDSILKNINRQKGRFNKLKEAVENVLGKY